ncbi:amidohydrolase family protein [Ornithinimicrobium sp. W1665]|uniref:amidohydrolase family protein n=1 Tax=Ornithinimicrobium sp. W1665 TaxID=3416666 RepID=UPI003CECFA3D
MPATTDLGLIDHHCHGLLRQAPSPQEFRLLSTEAHWPAPEGTESLDSPVGLAIRAICGPALGLPRHVPVAEYVDHRANMCAQDAHAALMPLTGIERYLIDTGFAADQLMSPEDMAVATGSIGEEIVRLEAVAEQVGPGSSAEGFAADFTAALDERAIGAVGFKSIIAYRWGFDLRGEAPGDGEVRDAVGRWLAGAESSGDYRISDPTLLQHLIWAAIPYQKPIQFHTGYGDSDVLLHRSDPSRLRDFFVATRTTGTNMMLLHCYPYIREAAIAAQLFPHVYCDVGLATQYLGPSATVAVRQVMEIAPFSKVLFSSDAYGLAELYTVSAHLWRHEMDRLLDAWIAEGWTSADDARRIATMIASGNALRAYNLGTGGREDARVLGRGGS